MSDRIDSRIAWQALASTTGGVGVSDEEVAWFSFEQRRMVLWDGVRDSIRMFPEETVACTRISENDEWIITTTEGLERMRFIDGTVSRATLLSEPWISRRSSKGTNVIVKASGDRLEIGQLRFNAESDEKASDDFKEEEIIQIRKPEESTYEYDIRD